MARILLASNTDDIRGKLGQIIYTKNQSVHTQRRIFKPSDKKSSSQLIQRNIFNSIAKAWKNADESERGLWIAAANEVIFINQFGCKYHPSGFNYYMMSNRNNFRFGGSNILLSPIIPTIHSECNFLRADATNGFPSPQLNLYFDTGNINQCKVLVSVTPPMAPATTNFKGKYTDLCLFDSGNFGTRIDIYNLYVAKFPAFASNLKIGIKCYISNNNTDNWLILSQMLPERIVLIAR